MKIKVQDKSYGEVMAIERPEHEKPAKQNRTLGLLLKILAQGDLRATDASYTEIDMERLGDRPALVLMNHSSFIDLKLAANYLYPRPFSIICTSDGFVGKYGLMRAMGCIPTNKFVSSPGLVRDMSYTLNKLNQSVLMYPEASYTFDGTATPLPEDIGRLLKMLKAPVVTILTRGAFARDPLYNGLRLRKVKVSATVRYLLSPEDIAEKSARELGEILKEQFTFDNFRWQQENRIIIAEHFRAEGLNRVLYKCPNCMAEGKTVGRGENLICEACGKIYHLNEYGLLCALEGETEFPHIPDWYAWERAEVRREIEEGRYKLDVDVDIRMMVDYRAIYNVGEGRLIHNNEGFHLTGCGGELDYRQSPGACYGLYADYFWYELGDMICIGDNRALYYCFPKTPGDVVAKTRLAAEEMYKLSRMSVRV